MIVFMCIMKYVFRTLYKCDKRLASIGEEIYSDFLIDNCTLGRVSTKHKKVIRIKNLFFSMILKNYIQGSQFVCTTFLHYIFLYCKIILK